ncbi:MAG: hypothetical protein CMN78_05560 [Spirochaetales bacterium]|nr:hypothetical protein [Spirochaetales bacterium]
MSSGLPGLSFIRGEIRKGLMNLPLTEFYWQLGQKPGNLNRPSGDLRCGPGVTRVVFYSRRAIRAL